MKKIIPLLFSLAVVFSLQAEESLASIMDKYSKVHEFSNLSGSIKVEMISQKGDSREIEARAYQKQVSDEQLNMLFLFDFPPTVRDTGILLNTYFNGEPSNMWIYLPAVKRIKRVSLEQSGGGYFMGSDFTYSDFILRTLEDYDREMIGEEVVDGRLCYVVKDWARDQKKQQEMGYSYLINYISKDNYFLYARDYYDLSGKLLKTYRVKDTLSYGSSVYPTNIVMHNVQTDHKSILNFYDYNMNEIDEDIFTTRYLRNR